MNHTTSEVQDLAADTIQRYGWEQGPTGWNNYEGSGYCLEGAIAAASGIAITGRWTGIGRVTLCPAYKAVEEFLADRAFTAQLWWFNDQVAKSEEDVIAVLRAAAAVERVKESAEQTVAA